MPDFYTDPTQDITYEVDDPRVSTSSKLEDIDNFQAYQDSELLEKFTRLPITETLRCSLPIARHPVRQVPNMIRESQDVISRKCQNGIQLSQKSTSRSTVQRASNLCPEFPRQPQPLPQAWENQVPEHSHISDLPTSHQHSQPRASSQAATAMDLQCLDFTIQNFGSSQNNACFCMGPCTCFTVMPTYLSSVPFAGERDTRILQLVQNISRQLVKLEQQARDNIRHSTDTIDPSSLSAQLESAFWPGIGQDSVPGCPGNLEPGTHIQEAICSFTNPDKDRGGTENNNDLDWDMSCFDIPDD